MLETDWFFLCVGAPALQLSERLNADFIAACKCVVMQEDVGVCNMVNEIYINWPRLSLTTVFLSTA